MLETIRRMLTGTELHVIGSYKQFDTSMGVKQRCPMSSLLFRLYFDRVVTYIHNSTVAGDSVHIAWLSIATALYADDTILFAPYPTSLQA